MDNNILFKSSRIMEKSLDLSSNKHRLITSNIANMNTPNYIPFDLVLTRKVHEDPSELEAHTTMYKTNSKHLDMNTNEGSLPHKIVPCPTYTENGGDNWVDIDAEMYKLSRNTLKYNALTKLLGKNFSQLRSVISERNR
ncbi:MAG: flagellar basal body rod protein FlgB [bacterium]